MLFRSPTNKLKADDPHYDKNYIQDSGEQFYNVKAGETLFSIAKRFNTNVDSLKKWNNLKKGGLQTGMKLKVGNRSSKVLEKSALSAADENAGKEKVTEKSPEKTEIKNNAGSKSGSGTGITPKKDLSVDESLLKKNIETARDSSRHAEKDAQDMENKTGGTKPDSSKEKKIGRAHV